MNDKLKQKKKQKNKSKNQNWLIELMVLQNYGINSGSSFPVFFPVKLLMLKFIFFFVIIYWKRKNKTLATIICHYHHLFSYQYQI